MFFSLVCVSLRRAFVCVCFLFQRAEGSTVPKGGLPASQQFRIFWASASFLFPGCSLSTGAQRRRCGADAFGRYMRDASGTFDFTASGGKKKKKGIFRSIFFLLSSWPASLTVMFRHPLFLSHYGTGHAIESSPVSFRSRKESPCIVTLCLRTGVWRRVASRDKDVLEKTRLVKGARMLKSIEQRFL
jgi:hypothetical protein